MTASEGSVQPDDLANLPHRALEELQNLVPEMQRLLLEYAREASSARERQSAREHVEILWRLGTFAAVVLSALGLSAVLFLTGHDVGGSVLGGIDIGGAAAVLSASQVADRMSEKKRVGRSGSTSLVTYEAAKPVAGSSQPAEG